MRAVVVPLKAFGQAKVRLAPALDTAARAELAREFARRVIGAAAPLPVTVVCEDDEVATFATSHGARVLWTPGLGLSGAVEAGVEQLATEGVTLAVVAHADLPLATSLSGLGTEGEVTLVPDHRLEGTNVVCVPTESGFRFSYGPGSFLRHQAEAARLGLRCQVVRDWRLAHDVDLPEDLVFVQGKR